MSSTNLLNAETLLQKLAETLPAAVAPQLANPQDALAALSHTILVSLGFRLINLGESHPVSQPSEGESAAVRLPETWNASGPDLYTFGYRHNQSSLEFLVKLVKVAGRLLVTATAVEHNRTAVWEITTSDFTSASFFPYRSPNADEAPLVNGFITQNRVQDFANEFNSRIIREILPGLTKDGYEQPSSSNEPSSSRQPEHPPRGEPFRPIGPTNPPPPLFNDPDDPSLPDAPYQPLGVGQRDLDPFAANPLPLPGRSGGTFAPPPLFGGDRGGGRGDGGGMFVGPNDPLFRGRFPPTPGTGLPPGAVPPGARFDPIFPGGQRYPQGPGRGPGFPRPPLGGDPDFDEFLPPRNSDYDNLFG